MKNLKTNSEKQMNNLIIFLSAIGISYSLSREFIFNKPDNAIILIIGCCLLAISLSRKNQQYL